MFIVILIYKISHAPITEYMKHLKELAQIFVTAIRRQEFGVLEVQILK
jgi:hypothetical protein